MRVAVVGAGVIGVTSAFAVKSAFPSYDVKIFANEFSPNTTGDGSAGLWSPYLLGDTSAEDIIRWAGRTFRWFEQLWKTGLSSETGVTLLPVTNVTCDHKDVEIKWKKLVYGFRNLSKKELERLSDEHRSNYTQGYRFISYTAEPVMLLPWLMKKFVALGGRVETRNIKMLHQLAEEGYNLIINCSGLGARELVADKTVVPIRGQVYRVNASWTMQCLMRNDGDACNYIIPNVNNVVMGGTNQENDFVRSVREDDSKHIYDGCIRMMPSLKGSKTIRAWVGFRPGRPRVRLEYESLSTPAGKEFKVIHNYGHGGSGVTLSWGCAVDVVAMIRNLKVPELNSKL
ncbi:hypothetical protein PUN28_003215 [Cardiocondyla obscurior]|uniref:FAD dependent oxidoreductase domain-containing protein n=1 Tax=Cardiocondyla obscurior TaxID=286306 RepID=A0AAW2GHX4_9HYME